MPVKWKESGAIPNSFSYRLGYNLSYFWGALHIISIQPPLSFMKLPILSAG